MGSSSFSEPIKNILKFGLAGEIYKKNVSEVREKSKQAKGAAQAQAETSRNLATELKDERRRRRLLLLNPSAELQTNMATGRSQLLGV